MRFSVEISKNAQRDLTGIYNYIAFELRSPENAAAQLERIEKAVLSLDYMPERFRRYDREPWNARNLRIMPVDKFLVFYIPDTVKGKVIVTRVMYSGRNIDAQLK